MINQIEEETGSLPVNLPRGVPFEVAAENIDVQTIIAPRLTMLMEIANSFLVTIIESMESVPYGIRWICKQIRSLTRVSRPLVWIPTLSYPKFSANILKPQNLRYAPLLVVSSSSVSSIQPLSRLKHTCWWTEFQLSILDGRLHWYVESASAPEVYTQKSA